MGRVVIGGNGITQTYKPGIHNGVDIGWRVNENDNTIIAHSDGVIVDLVRYYKTTDKSGRSYGNYVKIKHDNGYYTLYAHLKYDSVCVSKGQRVVKGQKIGVMGNTGYSKGRHLHFEVRNEKDVRINPIPYLTADLPSNEWVKGDYQMLVSKYIRTTPMVASNNKINYAGITRQSTKAKCYADKYGKAKTQIGTKWTLYEFKKDAKGNTWGKLEWDWVCVKDSTGNQVKKV